jgi:hypothetical protein
MDFQTFKEEKLGSILKKFISPEILNSCMHEYGITMDGFGKDLDSYEELYKTISYAFLIFGSAISKTLSEVRLYEAIAPFSSPTQCFSPAQCFSEETIALLDKAWYWVCNFNPDQTEVLPPTLMQYLTAESAMAHIPDFVILPEISNNPTFFGPIPLPKWRGNEGRLPSKNVGKPTFTIL